MDDLLDTTSPPEFSPVQSFDDDAIPPAEYGPPVDAFTSASDTPMENHMPNGTEGDSLSDGLFPGFLCFFLAGSPARIHPGWFFLFPFFCWTQGWGVLVCPWSTRVA